MKKLIVSTLILIFLVSGLSAAEKGGIMPCLASCLIGPRVGLEMNEGKKVETIELLHAFGGYIPYVGCCVRPVTSYMIGGKTNGVNGFLASCCLGPRVGSQLNQRKVRINEWLQLVCIGRILIPLEAYQGKTMTEIEAKEGLRK